MNLTFHNSWNTAVKQEFTKSYFKELSDFVEAEYQNYICFPPKDYIYNAFISCPLDDVKVVIIGQDPYHNHNQANGLCFSVNDGVVFHHR